MLHFGVVLCSTYGGCNNGSYLIATVHWLLTQWGYQICLRTPFTLARHPLTHPIVVHWTLT